MRLAFPSLVVAVAAATLALCLLSSNANAQEWSWTLNSVFCCNESMRLKPNATRIITLGGLFPMTGRPDIAGVERANVMALAISQINANHSLLPDTVLNGWVSDTRNTEAGALEVTFAQITSTDPIVYGLIGSSRSAESKIVAIVGSVIQLPQLSYSSTSAVLSDKNVYPYFARTVPSDSLQGRALVDLLVHFGWSRCVVVYTNDEYGQSIQEAVQVLGGQAEQPVRVVAATSIPTGLDPVQNSAQIADVLGVIRGSGARVVILASDATGMVIVRAAHAAGLLGRDYVWIASDSFAQNGLLAKEEDRRYLAGMLGTRPVSIVGDVGTREFSDKWATYNRTLFPGVTPNTFSPYVYDAVYAFAYAIEALLDAGTAITGTTLLPAIKDTRFVGTTGLVLFDEKGDRLGGKYDVVNVVGLDQTEWTAIGSWDTVDNLTITAPSRIRFGSALRPDADRPTDVAITTLEQEWSDGAAIVVIILAFLAFAMIFITLCVWLLKWTTPVIGSYQPALGLVVLVGMLVGCGACYAVVAPASDASCVLAPWLGGIAFQLVIGSLVIKAFAIHLHKIRHPEKIRFSLPLSLYVPALAMLLLFELTYLVIWTAVDKPEPDVQRVNFKTRINVCSSGDRWATYGWWALYVGPKFLLMLAATLIVPFLVNIHMVFQEAKYTAYFILAADIIAAIATAVTWALYSTQVEPSIGALIASLGILLTAWAAWLIVFVPKLLVVFVRRGKSVHEAEIDRAFDPAELDRIELS